MATPERCPAVRSHQAVCYRTDAVLALLQLLFILELALQSVARTPGIQQQSCVAIWWVSGRQTTACDMLLSASASVLDTVRMNSHMGQVSLSQ